MNTQIIRVFVFWLASLSVCAPLLGQFGFENGRNKEDPICGAKCLYVILRGYGKAPNTYKSLVAELGSTSAQGCSLLQLRDAARKHDLFAESVQLDQEALARFANSCSVILHLSKPVGLAGLPFYMTDSRFANDCMQLTTPTSFVTDIGLHWQGYQPRDLVYSHYSTPNSSHWDCQGGLRQLITARSYHRGGTVVLFADGHVNWVSASMNLSTWRALATVAGHEAESDMH